MIRRLKKTIAAIPALIKLFKSKTPQEGKDIAKSGVTSLAIAGSITAGKLQIGELDATLLIILGILEILGYLYGCVALSVGASQSEDSPS
ncbi:MAG TPA: hypothetical protein VJ917_04250 [Saprospiraceae bacterium]|nr:hypothetical protein [Saprospiraceae bacterium]